MMASSKVRVGTMVSDSKTGKRFGGAGAGAGSGEETGA